MEITFITGGARSGKSAFALQRASGIHGRKAYIATAEALDDEMRERISRHKAERGSEWDTHEEPLRVTDALIGLQDRYKTVLLDCLTIWLSNILIREADVGKEINGFMDKLQVIKDTSPFHLIIVSNEVGAGIVPENCLARRFRDLAGTLNQRVAEIADEVYLVTAGIPLKLK